MDSQSIMDLMQMAFRTTMLLSLPTLGVALAVGVAVSIFQAVTSIQEQTLVFVPKILAVIVALVVCYSFMMRTMLNFTYTVFRMIPGISH